MRRSAHFDLKKSEVESKLVGRGEKGERGKRTLGAHEIAISCWSDANRRMLST